MLAVSVGEEAQPEEPALIITAPVTRAAMLKRFPELADYSRTATRLHPRPGRPTALESSVGGPLLWPRDEPWPTCEQPHLVEKRFELSEDEAASIRAASLTAHDLRLQHLAYLESLGSRIAPEMLAKIRETAAAPPPVHTGPATATRYEFELPPEPVLLVPVLQIHQKDAPGLQFPVGADLLQILWCPNTHEPSGPQARALWRHADAVTEPLPTVPAPNRVERDGFVPQPCVTHPEDVVEYPPICLLDRDADSYTPFGRIPADLESRVRSWSDQQPETDDYFRLAHAPGWKVGGWDFSAADPDDLRTCDCGAPMRPLLSTFHTEDLGGWPAQGDPGFAWGDPQRWEDQEPTRVDIARNGTFQILYCPTDPRQHPLSYVID